MFSIILTDNGAEFSDPEAIEINPDTGEKRTQLFYCDPRSSQQKARIEQVHTFIRRFIPQGESFVKYTQKDINLMISHINSTPREHLNKKSPIELFQAIYGDQIICTRYYPNRAR